MSRKPIISVVIPCFNVAATVTETLASVVSQTMDDFEIIAVDNNCTDGTVSTIQAIAKDEPRLRIVKQPVQGLSAARNGGIAAAQGKYIAFLDADDLWDKDYLETHLANLEEGGFGVSYSRLRYIDVAGVPTGQTTNPKLSDLTARDLLLTNPCTSLIVVRADVIDKVGPFDEELRSVEDQEWLFRAAVANVPFGGIDRVLASYRIMPGGLSADLDNMLRCHGLMLDAAARVAPELTRGHRRIARGSMLRYCARRAIEHNKGAELARGYLWDMAKLAPDLVIREPKQTLTAMARVLLPDAVSNMAKRSSRLRAEEA